MHCRLEDRFLCSYNEASITLSLGSYNALFEPFFQKFKDASLLSLPACANHSLVIFILTSHMTVSRSIFHVSSCNESTDATASNSLASVHFACEQLTVIWKLQIIS